ncbi:hypothetical protein [Tautonia plasticadhaerens]|uniref:Uncharacterized protein n=1 Tax=Tautonia plasticadhaerens TaxID=2527974 RepID=A0A518H0E2_9BACT|nr:hypothetical protein [Tautonia plasticadhaerens]QDV34315.1 hypothetical protein ElP_22000 [Tautonia plasticadhaerens]
MPADHPQPPSPAPPDGGPSPAWLRLSGALAAASAPKSLAMAVVGVVLTRLGTWASRVIFPGEQTGVGLGWRLAPGISEGQGWGAGLGSASSIAADPWFVLLDPLRGLFAIGRGNAVFARSLVELAWVVLVWGLVGGAIARMAAVGAAAPGGEGLGIGSALRFVGRRVASLVTAPLGPLALVAGLAIPGAVLGLIGRWGSELSGGIASALAIVPILLAVPSAMLVLGVAFTWPLMVLTVAVEGEDGFEALGRAFSYARRRAGHYALAVLGSWGLGTVGVLLVGLFAGLVVHLASWAFALGGEDRWVEAGFRSRSPAIGVPDPDRLRAISRALDSRGNAPPPSFDDLPRLRPDTFLGVWIRCVGLVAYAWAFSFFWSAFARIYLLLRREVDGTPWEDLYDPVEDAEPFAPDPPAQPGPPPRP